ncbi:MAG TPA: prolyl oligopeptidase family serine peptidase [Streptosporangiaceae bacterium]
MSCVRSGRLRFHSPDGTQWCPDRLREVLGQPVQHHFRPEWFAGVSAGPDGPRCWVADVAARTVTFVPSVSPALLAAGETPLAWAGASLAVAVTPPPAPADDIRQVIEAAPGARVRVTPAGDPADRRPAHIVIVDPRDGTGSPTGLRPRPYERLRAAPTGHVAATTAGDAAAVAVAAPGSPDEQLVPVGGRLRDVRWLATGRTAHLVLLADGPSGFAVWSCAVSGGGAEALRPLHRHAGSYLDSRQEGSLFILALTADGGYTAVIVGQGDARPAVRTVALPVRLPTVLRLAAARAPAAGDPMFATVDATDQVVFWSAPAGSATARRHRERTLPAGEEFVAVAGWDGRDPAVVVMARQPRTPPPVRPGGGRPVRGPAGDAEVALHLPEHGPPAACLVWLSQRDGGPGEGSQGGGGPDPHWLTLAGFAVLDVRLAAEWWPDVPDEEIRPRLVRQIGDAVAGSGIDRHAAGGGLAVGGASFGATLALLAAADCDLFTAAIAQSGAYARQLTPLGFQDETRTLWAAPRVYQDFDAVVNAPRIRKPVLIIHGEADRNPATPVAQATLLFQALVANGTRARLVVLSGEGHSPLTRDGIAAALAEKAAWLRSHCAPH